MADADDVVAVEDLTVAAYTVPTDFPEADGTLEWDCTTIVVVRAASGDQVGIGYTYADASVARLIHDTLAAEVIGADAMSPPAVWQRLLRRVRNLGRAGLAACAIAAVDTALWDLKARLLGLPLVRLLGLLRDDVAVYGSGGFTSYPPDRLTRQLGEWVGRGIPAVKMKVGARPGDDPRRVHLAREAIGPAAALFVDANGAYDAKQAVAMAEAFAAEAVTWYEEPVSSDDLAGLRLVRQHAPTGMEVAAGEYGYDLFYFRQMLESGAVDVLQADITRCGGITGFLGVAALCQAFHMPLSAHTAPALHLHPACAAAPLRHLEYFHDHVRIEALLFDGAPEPRQGRLAPDLSRLGNGLSLKEADAARYAA